MSLRVALLRSMVIGGHRLSGADVCALAEAAGATDIRPVAATGNVVFRSRKAPATLVRNLEAECERRWGKATEVVVKTAEEWRKLVAANPFKAVARKHPNRVLLWVMREPVPARGIAQLRRHAHASETITRLRSGDFYIHLGMPHRDDTQIIKGFGLNRLGAVGTNRTWTTISAITRTLDALEAEQD